MLFNGDTLRIKNKRTRSGRDKSQSDYLKAYMCLDSTSFDRFPQQKNGPTIQVIAEISTHTIIFFDVLDTISFSSSYQGKMRNLFQYCRVLYRLKIPSAPSDPVKIDRVGDIDSGG